jgi:hypothetical protein
MGFKDIFSFLVQGNNSKVSDLLPKMMTTHYIQPDDVEFAERLIAVKSTVSDRYELRRQSAKVEGFHIRNIAQSRVFTSLRDTVEQFFSDKPLRYILSHQDAQAALVRFEKGEIEKYDGKVKLIDPLKINPRDQAKVVQLAIA